MPMYRGLHGCRAQLQVLYNAGARKFIVFGLPAIEQLPIINVANRVVNIIDAGKSLPKDGVLSYAKSLSVRATPPSHTANGFGTLITCCLLSKGERS